jgi:hypothetical protein
MGETLTDMIVANCICIISIQLFIHSLDYEIIAAEWHRCINIQTNYDSSELFLLGRQQQAAYLYVQKISLLLVEY